MDSSNTSRDFWQGGKCAVVVAHPDDETLWAGGTILMHPDAEWTILALSRATDPDRAPKFFKALGVLGTAGAMGNLDDGPEQNPLNELDVEKTILELLPSNTFDLIITHGQYGEYTRHLRHEETSKAVSDLCDSGKLFAKRLWNFAYEDNKGASLPRAIRNADIFVELADDIWKKKYTIITETYGFSDDSFEARTTPRAEAFWSCKLP